MSEALTLGSETARHCITSGPRSFSKGQIRNTKPVFIEKLDILFIMMDYFPPINFHFLKLIAVNSFILVPECFWCPLNFHM